MKVIITKTEYDYMVELKPDFGNYVPEVKQLFGGKNPNDAYTDNAFDDTTIRQAAVRWAEEWLIEHHKNETIKEVVLNG